MNKGDWPPSQPRLPTLDLAKHKQNNIFNPPGPPPAALRQPAPPQNNLFTLLKTEKWPAEAQRLALASGRLRLQLSSLGISLIKLERSKTRVWAVLVITPNSRINLGPTRALQLFLDQQVAWLGLEELSQRPSLDPLLNLPVHPESKAGGKQPKDHGQPP